MKYIQNKDLLNTLIIREIPLLFPKIEDELIDDARWRGYEVPPKSNANYGWILNMVSKLSDNGIAG